VADCGQSIHVRKGVPNPGGNPSDFQCFWALVFVVLRLFFWASAGNLRGCPSCVFHDQRPPGEVGIRSAHLGCDRVSEGEKGDMIAPKCFAQGMSPVMRGLVAVSAFLWL